MSEANLEPYQKELGIRIADRLDFDTFEMGENKAALSMLRNKVMNKENEFFFVFGPKSCGKSHLLSALFAENNQDGNTLLLDLNLVKALGAAMLDVPLPKIVLLDNVDAIAGDSDLELALFGLYNRWYDRRDGILIMTATASFDQIPFQKRDINTRLSSGITLQLNYLKEEDCIGALKKRAKGRFLNIPDKTIAFLVRHCNRNMPNLLEALNTLESAQIEHNHEITVPFVKKVLQIS